MNDDQAFPPHLMQRRDVLKFGGFGALAAALAVSGASPLRRALDGVTGTSGTASVVAVDDAESIKSTITLAISGDPSSIDPIASNNAENVEVYWLVNEQLYQYGPKQVIEPMLATKLPTVSTDGLTFTIPLPTGVTFSNGKTFDSSDVKYTYEQVSLAANASPWASFLAQVSSITTPNPQTVVFTLTSVDTYFLDTLASIPIIPSNVPYTKTTYANTLIGTGPYKLDAWDHNEQLTFSAFSGYRTKGMPVTPNIVYKIIPTEAASLASLAAGTIDLLPNVSAQAASTLKSRGLGVYQAPGLNGVMWLWPNFTPGRPTANVNLRLAMAWAIDRERIVKQVFYGFGAPSSTIPGAGSAFYSAKWGEYFGSSPNVKKAKAYLAKAGGAPKTPISITVDSSDPLLASALTIIQENFQAIGLDVSIESVDPATASTKRTNHDFDIYAQDSVILIPASQGYLLYAKGSSFNYNNMNDPVLNALALNVEKYTRSDPRAAAAVVAVQKRVTEVVPLVGLCTYSSLFGTGKGVRNFAEWNAADYWDLAKTTVQA
jgi:peptide/nickel transport system substrate-binding protein